MTRRASPSVGDPPRFVLWHWTDDPVEAQCCARAGVDRIGIDLDRLGKAERQPGSQSWISPHRIESLAHLRKALPDHCLFLRTNPLNDGSRAEVDLAIAMGADLLMLPNFQTIAEVSRFLDLVAGRVPVVPLVERRLALGLLDGMVEIGITEIHFGLNDLSLDFGVENRLSLFLHPEMEQAFDQSRRLFARFGIGGIAAPDTPGLPVSAASVLCQHVRLGSSGAMLARSFWRDCSRHDRDGIEKRITSIRQCLAQAAQLSHEVARTTLHLELASSE